MYNRLLTTSPAHSDGSSDPHSEDAAARGAADGYTGTADRTVANDEPFVVGAGAPRRHRADDTQRTGGTVRRMRSLHAALEHRSPLVKACVAEALGTFIVLALGTSVVAQHALTNGHVAAGGVVAEEAAAVGLNADSTALHLCWGLAVSFGVLASFRRSGAHLNPAVTLALASAGRHRPSEVLPYIAAQCAGAFLGAAWTFVFYSDLIACHLVSSTAAVFHTGRAPYMSWGGAFLDEAMATAFLQIGIMAVVDDRGKHPPTIWHVAGFVGLLVAAIGMAFGANTGYAINPARDVAPRLFVTLVGWAAGSSAWANVLTMDSCYVLVPLFAPLVGGTIAAQFMHSIHGYMGSETEECTQGLVSDVQHGTV